MNLLEQITAWIKRWQDPPRVRAERSAGLQTGRGAKRPRVDQAGDHQTKSFTVLAGWCIDGSGGPIRQQTRLEIVDGIIQRIKGAPVPLAFAVEGPHRTVLDFSACTLLPGLVDSHVHLAMTGSVDEALRSRLRQASADVVCQAIQENLREHLRYGAVAVRDAGGARGSALRFAKGLQRRTGPPVRVFAAGRAWHRQGRYGRFIGRSPDPGLRLGSAILGDDSSCDHVKIVNSGVNSLTEFGRRTAAQFSLEEMASAVQVCRQRGLPVMVHANGEEPVRIAIAAGCHSLEHGFFMGSENLKRLAEQGTVWVPTVVAMHAFARPLGSPDRRAQVARRTVDHQLEQLQRARSLNLIVALGTDSGSPGVDHGCALIEEMKLLMAAGFSLPETIRCASLNGARLAGGDFGLLAEGRPATFIVVPGAPSELPDSLKRIRSVYVDGEQVLAAG